MIRQLARRFFLFGVLAVLGVGHAFAQEDEELVIAFNEKPPFFYFEGGRAMGVVIARVSEAMRLTGLRYHYEEMPFQRLIYNLKKQRPNFVVLGLSKNSAREQFSTFSSPVFKDRTPVVLIRREDHEKFSSYESLERVIESGLYFGRKVGTVQTADSLLRKLGGRDLPFETEVKGFPLLLAKKRFDFTILYPEEVEFAIKASGVDREQLKVLSFPDMPPGDFRYLLFSKRTKRKLIESINAAIEQLQPQ